MARASSADDYPALTRGALQGQLPGSSAGGEQPKFCCVTQGRSVIVKFSSGGDSLVDQRTRDLLLCEHLALEVLRQAGLPAARTQLFLREGRVFLESERFDRCSPWAGEAPGAAPPGRRASGPCALSFVRRASAYGQGTGTKRGRPALVVPRPFSPAASTKLTWYRKPPGAPAGRAGSVKVVSVRTGSLASWQVP